MKNNIVFTQDAPGEREWIAQFFPGAVNFESEFSGKWPPNPFGHDFNAVWEIPPDSALDVSVVPATKYKSLFQIDAKFISPRWCDADKLLIKDLDFVSTVRSDKAQVLHFARSGTVFLESILFTKCKYTKDRGWNPDDPHCDHWQLGGNDQLLYATVQQHKPDIFFCYRKNWWEWFVSLQIGIQFDYYHYYDKVPWDELNAFEITADHMDQQAIRIHAAWNAMCHFRTLHPNLNFYIFEFSDLIQNQNLTDHKKISYNKQSLIKNYNEAKELFESKYRAKFERWEQNAISHLQAMNCKILKNFDSLIA